MFSIRHACRPSLRIRRRASLLPRSRRNMSSKVPSGGMKMDPVPGVQNQHFYVDKDGTSRVDLSFVEEPLGLPGSEGYGWPQLEFGDKIGPDARYEIKRKLGWGMSSSTWLAYDTGMNDYVAIKALTGFSTELRRRGRVWELEALQRVAGSNHCLHLLNEFTHPGKGSSGDHSCLVTPVYGGDVKTLWTRHNEIRNFPLPLAKRMLLHTLRGIAHAHSKGVIHTDLKHDNIFFTSLSSRQDIDANVVSDPPRRNPPEASLDGAVCSAVTQPLPVPSLDDAMKCQYLIADFGSAQLFDQPKELEVTSAPLRAPEVLLLGSWNEKVDIWTFGCLIFEFIVGRSLFRHEAFTNTALNVTLDDIAYHLYQMACFIGEVEFPPEVLQYSRLASTYFNTDCTFKNSLPLQWFSIKGQINNTQNFSPEDVKSTTEIVERCLELDPADRPTAAELLNDPWFVGVE